MSIAINLENDSYAAFRSEVLDIVSRRDISPNRLFDCRPANAWTIEAAMRPNPRQLWKELWFEGELCCLFADTNVGKSIYAVQIADEISKTQPVLYFDFEMSDKQFQMRYTSDDGSDLHEFGNGFMRLEINKASAVELNLATIIAQIETELIEQHCKVLIIDNISWICNRAESGDAAGELMQMLIGLKRKHGLSILVLAHTPKRNTSAPLTQNSLAGSKRIANFMDSMFAIGVSTLNAPAGRYIKQIKVRSCEMTYGESNVITATLCKKGDNIVFEHTGFACERDLLDSPDEDDIRRDGKSEEIRRRLAEGESTSSIAKNMSISLRDVYKVKKQTV